jgi:hypothetical protein
MKSQTILDFVDKVNSPMNKKALLM